MNNEFILNGRKSMGPAPKCIECGEIVCEAKLDPYGHGIQSYAWSVITNGDVVGPGCTECVEAWKASRQGGTTK